MFGFHHGFTQRLDSPYKSNPPRGREYIFFKVLNFISSFNIELNTIQKVRIEEYHWNPGPLENMKMNYSSCPEEIYNLTGG